jgi:hypothetical protein
LRLIDPPGNFQGFSNHPARVLKTPAYPGVQEGYKAFGAKMASKNMMNHYLRPNRPFALNVLLTQAFRR